MNLKDVLPKLQERFPVESHRERSLPGGGSWWYIPWQAVRERLNEVCPGEWSVEQGEPKYLEEYCYVQCKLTICGWTQIAIGNAQIRLVSSSGKDMSRGNPIERAIADGFKNAAELFGIAAYLDEQADSKTKEEFARWMRKQGNSKAAVQIANKAAGKPERSANGPRILAKQNELGISREQLNKLMQDNFRTDDPTRLSVSQCDQLLALMDGFKSSLEPQPTGEWEQGNYATPSQVKRLWAIAKAAGFTAEGVKALLLANGISSSKEIPRNLYEPICDDGLRPDMAAHWNKQGEALTAAA